MNLLSRIEQDFIQAFKGKEKTRISVLRLLRSALKNEEIKLKQELTGEQVLQIVNKDAKKHQDSIKLFRQAEREDLASKEEVELKILQEYLPEQMTEEKIREIVKNKVEEFGATNMTDFGKVMKSVMTETGGQADGGVVSKIVKEILGG